MAEAVVKKKNDNSGSGDYGGGGNNDSINIGNNRGSDVIKTLKIIRQMNVFHFLKEQDTFLTFRLILVYFKIWSLDLDFSLH